MSFQAYLDTIEQKTGLTPRQFMNLATEKGFNATTKAGEILLWLKTDYELGRGHGMALVHVIKNDATISDAHVNTGGVHSDDSNTLFLDGIKNR
jgi:hypothetical protein